MLKWDGKTFGYIMDLRPSEYVELVDFMNAKKKVHFDSFKAAVTAALEMVAAFRILHSKGYSYQDLSDGNFFINPKTGSVLICDNDNVSEYGHNLGILGTPQYMAPEIVRGEALPSTNTDRFSLAVVIFILITMTHPLEGARHLVELLNAKNERILYGTDPVFILDPEDKRNRPVAGVHTNIGLVWPALPAYVKEMFRHQFSREVMMNPQMRATEADWLELLVRFRGDIIGCSCGEDVFSHDENAPRCTDCGKPLPVRGYLQPSGVKYKVPAVDGNVIYRCQLGPANVDVAGDPVFQIRRYPKDPKLMVIQNVSGAEFRVTKPDGRTVPMGDKSAALAERGTVIRAFDGSLTVL
jgi:serine/threonine protein kinase